MAATFIAIRLRLFPSTLIPCILLIKDISDTEVILWFLLRKFIHYWEVWYYMRIRKSMRFMYLYSATKKTSKNRI